MREGLIAGFAAAFAVGVVAVAVLVTGFWTMWVAGASKGRRRR